MIAAGFIIVDGESRPMFSSSRAGLICQVFTQPPPMDGAATSMAPVRLIARRPGFEFIELPDGQAVEIRVPTEGMTQEIWEKALEELKIPQLLRDLSTRLEELTDTSASDTDHKETPIISSSTSPT